MSNFYATPRTVALSMGFPRQEYWNGLSLPSPGNLLDPGMETASPVLAGGVFTTEPPGKPLKSRLLNGKDFTLLTTKRPFTF